MKLAFLCTADLWKNLAVSILIVLLTGSPATAQVNEPDIAELRKELERVKTAADLTDAVRAMAEQALKQAIEQVELTEQWHSKADEFSAARKQAPAMLKNLAVDLDKPLVEVALAVPDGVTLSDMEQLLEQAESELDIARNTAAQLDAEKLRRAARRLELPKLLTDAGMRLNAAEDMLKDTPPSNQSPALVSALKALNLARTATIQMERQALQNELASYEARGGLLKARLQMADRQIAMHERLVAFWNQQVNKERSREAEEA
ncbi:MAG: hypothetical protein HKP55_13970, partial [Gammaproteobacteria bacterium]|nr:hypothetical protein [Gammaproteobacteria bacterium]